MPTCTHVGDHACGYSSSWSIENLMSHSIS